MRISVLCSDPAHPIYDVLAEWCTEHAMLHQVELVNICADLSGGDLLFLISCTEIIGPHLRNRYRKCLVIHASDLPEGRGWSPLVWQIIEGRGEIAVTLLEAAEKVDSGDIWKKVYLKFEGHELADEIYNALFAAELELMDFGVRNFESVIPEPQADSAPSYYRRRTPEDSRIDPHKSLAEQFDLLRVADNKRYPAFFDYRGCRYEISLKKSPPDE